jgi:hypothetical protein
MIVLICIIALVSISCITRRESIRLLSHSAWSGTYKTNQRGLPGCIVWNGQTVGGTIKSATKSRITPIVGMLQLGGVGSCGDHYLFPPPSAVTIVQFPCCTKIPAVHHSFRRFPTAACRRWVKSVIFRPMVPSTACPFETMQPEKLRWLFLVCP